MTASSERGRAGHHSQRIAKVGDKGAHLESPGEFLKAMRVGADGRRRGQAANRLPPEPGVRGDRRAARRVDELFLEIAEDEVAPVGRTAACVNSQTASCGGPASSLRLQAALKTVRHRGEGVIGVAQRGDTGGPQRIELPPAAAPLRCRIADPRFEEALALEPVEGGIDGVDRHVASRAGVNFLPDRGAVRVRPRGAARPKGRAVRNRRARVPWS